MTELAKTFCALAIILVVVSCSKVSQERLQGTWQVKEIKEIPVDIFDVWSHWLDTTQVKVVFFENGSLKTFYLSNDSLSGFSMGKYELNEEDEKLLIADTSLVFNPHGYPLDVILLRRNKLVLEGRYYLNAIETTLPPDSFKVLQWTLEK
ncbi:MAG TPA: hypothetical protein VNJ07_09050 [Chitinophagales bacterium]|nr:hypothetical protein [Chitinophagales bacterium]